MSIYITKRQKKESLIAWIAGFGLLVVLAVIIAGSFWFNMTFNPLFN